MAIAELAIHRPDIIPSLEEQREAREITVNLTSQQFVCVGDEKNSVFIRRTTGIKVFGREVHDGVSVVAGILRLKGENSYQIELAGVGLVEIKGGAQAGQGRDFIISKPKGVTIDTNGRVMLESVDAKKPN
mgnify:CR=1 FL=1